MYKQANTSKRKNIIGPIFAVIIVVVIIYIIYRFVWVKDLNTDQQSVIKFEGIDNTGIDVETIEFAGQEVDLDNPALFDLRERLEKEIYITLYVDYQLILRVKRTGLYFGFIEKELADRGLPDDLKYIAVAESYLNNSSISSVGAGGIWQFMPATAKQYGLIVDDYVDERYNYEKATSAALDYLEVLNERFNGDRFLSMAAYNMGENGLQKVIDSQDEKNYFALLLNEETSRYIFRILAVKYIYENRNILGINIDKEAYYKLPSYVDLKISEIKDIKTFVKNRNISLYTFVKLNPWIKYQKNVLPYRSDGKDWTIRLLSD